MKRNATSVDIPNARGVPWLSDPNGTPLTHRGAGYTDPFPFHPIHKKEKKPIDPFMALKAGYAYASRFFRF